MMDSNRKPPSPDEALRAMAGFFRRLGEEQQSWERDQIHWRPGIPPFDDFFFYVCLAAVWQSFSRRLEGKPRRDFVFELYQRFNRLLSGHGELEDLLHVLRKHRSSRFMVGKNLLALWLAIGRKMREDEISTRDPIAIQRTAEACASRSQHWLAYAPIEAAVVVGDLFTCSREILPPLGGPVMKSFAVLGLPFSYPPTRAELHVIHSFLLRLADLAQTNHLLIEMGIWYYGWKK